MINQKICLTCGLGQLQTAPHHLCENCKTYSTIDAELYEVIKTLNDKGYPTQYCCAGHDYDRLSDGYMHGYIFFDKVFELSSPPKFSYRCREFDHQGRGLTFRWLSKSEKGKMIKMKRLLRWAESLEQRN